VKVITKGAPEGILPLCTRVERDSNVVPVDTDAQTEANRTFERLSRSGFHLLAIAWKPTPPEQMTLSADDERDLVLSGFAAFLDPPDPSARETLAALRDAGVALKILTGDGELVTRTICH
jgi:P-type Mg2+ transporter